MSNRKTKRAVTAVAAPVLRYDFTQRELEVFHVRIGSAADALNVARIYPSSNAERFAVLNLLLREVREIHQMFDDPEFRARTRSEARHG